MKIFSTIKQLATLQPMLMQFALDQVYYRRERRICGSFHLQANVATNISAITIEVVQNMKIDKTHEEVSVLGKQAWREQITLGRFDKHEVAFDIDLKFPRASKREVKNYKGDLGPLNKATDKAKKQLFFYLIRASIKLKGKKDPLMYEEKLRVE